MPRCVGMGFSNTTRLDQYHILKHTELLQMHPLIFSYREILEMLAESLEFIFFKSTLIAIVIVLF